MADLLKILPGLDTVDAAQWDALAGGNPTVSHAFLDSLHRSGCASEATGWKPQYLSLWRDGALAGAVPLYLKSHSYGEYVFDWAWADAYERHDLSYYPKLLSAVPFTPALGPRLLARDAAARRTLAEALVELARASDVSSLHVLFPPAEDADALRAAGLLERRGVQFHWRNPGYADFEDFLSRLSHDKRKKIRQERRRVESAGVTFRRVIGREATKADWDFFHHCYRRTYAEHRSTPYLTRRFFEMLGARMGGNVLLVIAERAGKPIAAALDLFTPAALYGRYWGSVEHIPGLHFEACYYQAMEFCIDCGIELFEGGAQGEHKHARGFLPEVTRSLHWLAHPAFYRAVDEYLARERNGIGAYVDELADRSPFRRQEMNDMSNNRIAKASIEVDAPRSRVWGALVDPAAIEQYMFGAHVQSDWKPGSPITWKGEWQGKAYEDKGTILEVAPERRLRYSHFSPLSGLPDRPENYHNVSIELSGNGAATRVSLEQDNNADEKARAHSEKNWNAMLQGLKKLLER